MNDWSQELEKYLNKSFQSIKPGTVVSGEIVKISEDYAFVDLGLKKEALLSVEEIKTADGNFILKEGDKITALVIGRSRDDGSYILSFKKLREKTLWEELKKAYQERKTIKVRVSSLNKGGYEVEYEFLKGFMPFSQSFFRKKPQNPDSLIGETVEVEVLEIKNNRFLVSRRKVLEREYNEKKQALIEKIKAGEPLEGVVSRKVEGGFLVEIEEIMVGYLPYRELEWKRIENPSEYLKIGDKVRVKPISYDPGKERLKLSIKALLPDPWEGIEKRYKEGDIVEGRVIQILNFGAFVELEPGVEGFIPAKEITWNRKVKIDEILEKGDKVSAYVLELNPSERKILLSLRKLQPDPWLEAIKNYKIGDTVEGVITKILPKGLVIELSPEITAFMPLKEFLRDFKTIKKGVSEIEGFKVGDKIKGKIIDIDKEKKRVSLSYLRYLEELENKEIEEYKIKSQKSSLLTLGDILAKKLS